MKTPRELEILSLHLCVCAHVHKCTNSLACKQYMFTYDQKLTWSAFFNCSWLSSSIPASLSVWLAPGIRCVWALGSHTAVNPSWRLHDCRESELLASGLYSKPFAYWPSLQLPWQSKQIFGDTGLEPTAFLASFWELKVLLEVLGLDGESIWSNWLVKKGQKRIEAGHKPASQPLQSWPAWECSFSRANVLYLKTLHRCASPESNAVPRVLVLASLTGLPQNSVTMGLGSLEPAKAEMLLLNATLFKWTLKSGFRNELFLELNYVQTMLDLISNHHIQCA